MHEEIDAEDIVSESVKEQQLLVRNIKGKNVQEVKWIPSKPVNFENEASTSKTGLGIKELKMRIKTEVKLQPSRRVVVILLCMLGNHCVNDNMPNMHNMPAINLNHKPCGVTNCMSCAFNVMSAYFYSMHTSNNKTTPRQHVNNNKKHVRCKTDRPPKARKMTFVPKPKQKVVKAVYRVKMSSH